MTPKISFAITTHNEGEYIQRLLDQLIPHCRATGDEIIILDDYSDDQETKWILSGATRSSVVEGQEFRLRLASLKLNGDFAAHKNHLNAICRGTYILQVDADETLHPNLLENLHALLDANETVDLFAIPRVNTVEGLTEEDIRRWGWRINEKGWVMFPDYQTRLYRNSPDIKWEGKVHERITGHKTMTPLPAEEEWSLYHGKTIERQRKQNDFYSTIGR
jgi:glycosyltransferase involved in cell wall biosynthesis